MNPNYFNTSYRLAQRLQKTGIEEVDTLAKDFLTLLEEYDKLYFEKIATEIIQDHDETLSRLED